MSFVSAVSFTVRNFAQAQRWYPALVNAQLVQNSGFLVAGRAPATLARVVVQTEGNSDNPTQSELGDNASRTPVGISFPYLGIASSNMTKSRRDLERFGGPLDAGEATQLSTPEHFARHLNHSWISCS